jgi:hypothetical protein
MRFGALHHRHLHGQWNGCTGRIILFLIGLLLLSGCSPVLTTEQPAHLDWIVLSEDRSIGQTLVARFDGLDGIAFHLRPEEDGQGVIRFYLRRSPESQENLIEASLPLNKVGQSSFYRFSFPPISGSTNQTYYAFLELEGSGAAAVATGPASAYINGALYQDHQPVDAQAAFRLSYNPSRLAAGMARMGLLWIGELGLLLFMFAVPGWAVFSFFDINWDQRGWIEKLALSCGLGLAVYPLLVLWADVAGLRMGPLFAWAPPLLGLAVLGIRYFPKLSLLSPAQLKKNTRDSLKRARSQARNPNIFRDHPHLLPDLALLCVLGLVVITRFWSIRNLAGPMWGDSVQHVVMAQLFIDHGGLYESWQPYAPYSSLTVQYGFALYSALFSWITGQPSLQATLVMGQLINILAISGLVPLAMYLSGGRRWAAVGAALAAGLLSPTPAVYVNWGRYPQLAGLAILPVALWAFLQVGEGINSEEQKFKWSIQGGRILTAGILLSGAILSYYRMAIFYAAFGLVWLFVWAIPRWKKNKRKWLTGILHLAWTAGIAALSLLPWAGRLLGSKLAGFVETGVSSGSQIEAILSDYQVWQQIKEYLPLSLLVFAGIAFLWSLARREWMIIAIPVWFALIIAYPSGQLIGLPAANMIQSFAVMISAYLPAALLAGWLTAEVVSLISLADHHSVTKKFALNYGFSIAPVAALGLLAVGIYGAKELRSIAHPDLYAMLTFPDLRAMEWIRDNTPEDAIFLVEGFRDRPYAAVGSDAGWYIPVLAGRKNSMPPQYAILSEQPETPGYSQAVVSLISTLEAHPIPSNEAREALCTFGITHAFVGQGQGQVGIGATPLFTYADLEASGWFHLLNRQDRTAVFAMNPTVCSANH